MTRTRAQAGCGAEGCCCGAADVCDGSTDVPVVSGTVDGIVVLTGLHNSLTKCWLLVFSARSNANPVQPTPAPREVEGFHGFMSALEAPKDAPAVNPNQQTRQSKPVQPEYRGSNVFAVLDNGDEEQQQKAQMAAQAAAPPAFMQPATFTFGAAKPTFTLQSSLRQSLQQPVAVSTVQGEDIDPDL
ncbi:unnamed protein product [Phytophthora lilii]|uniref:Unnamed protein product n=1 Tax=Phytophthora lilii TaxID=2077276 RepID=A0A9W6TIK4_9STRA|nr:unnamed protein product [Phytophthora lilii]